MNTLATIGTFALSFALSFSVAASSVQVIEQLDATQNASILVTTGGQLQASAKVEVADADGKSVLSLTTDSHGLVILPDLPPGRYYVVASTSPTRRGDVYLLISGGHVRKRSTFSVALTEQPPLPPTLEERLTILEKASTEAVTRVFSGIVVDPSGGLVAKVAVSIFRRGAAYTLHPQTVSTDQDGLFSIALQPGKYTAVFQRSGFETRFLTFEISPEAKQEALKVKLSVGVATESVSVAQEKSNH